MDEVILVRLARLRIGGKSPLGAYLRVNESVWTHLAPRTTALQPVQSYGHFLHSLVLANANRQMYLGTFFLRNRPELRLVGRLAMLRSKSSEPVRIAVLGCSNGAEVYSLTFW